MKISEFKDELKDAVVVKKGDSVESLAKAMKESGVRSAFIVDADQKPVAIATQSDIVNDVIAEGKDPKATTVDEIMSKSLIVCNIENDVKAVAMEMNRKKLLHVPVTENGKLTKVLTYNQALQHFVKACEVQQ